MSVFTVNAEGRFENVCYDVATGRNYPEFMAKQMAQEENGRITLCGLLRYLQKQTKIPQALPAFDVLRSEIRTYIWTRATYLPPSMAKHIDPQPNSPFTAVSRDNLLHMLRNYVDLRTLFRFGATCVKHANLLNEVLATSSRLLTQFLNRYSQTEQGRKAIYAFINSITVAPRLRAKPHLQLNSTAGELTFKYALVRKIMTRFPIFDLTVNGFPESLPQFNG